MVKYTGQANFKFGGFQLVVECDDIDYRNLVKPDYWYSLLLDLVNIQIPDSTYAEIGRPTEPTAVAQLPLE
jgi:hypothetical protein